MRRHKLTPFFGVTLLVMFMSCACVHGTPPPPPACDNSSAMCQGTTAGQCGTFATSNCCACILDPEAPTPSPPSPTAGTPSPTAGTPSPTASPTPSLTSPGVNANVMYLPAIEIGAFKPASAVTPPRVFVQSMNATDVCCMYKDVTGDTNLLRTDVFGGPEAHQITYASKQCRYSGFEGGIPYHSSQYETETQNGIPVRGFDLNKIPAGKSYAYLCRGVWDHHSAVTFSGAHTFQVYQTPGGVAFNESQNLHAVEVEATGDDAGTSVIVVGAAAASGTESYTLSKETSARKMDNVPDAYFCPTTDLETAHSAGACLCTVKKQRLGVPVDQAEMALEVLSQQTGPIHVRLCVVVGGLAYAGALKSFKVATLASDQGSINYPATLFDHVESDPDQEEEFKVTRLRHDKLVMHSTGASYSIPPNGRVHYKDVLSQTTWDTRIQLCTNWVYRDLDVTPLDDPEKCVPLNKSDAIQVPPKLRYGVATFRWKYTGKEVYSHSTLPISFGWFAGLVDVKVSMKHFGNPPFALNPDPFPSTLSVQRHLRMYDSAETLVSTDKFTVTPPPIGYTCYKTYTHAAEVHTSQNFQNLCDLTTPTGCFGSLPNYTTTFECKAGSFASKLETVSIQNCNPNQRLHGEWVGRSFSGPTDPVSGSYRNRCAFSAAMLVPDDYKQGVVTGTMPFPCTYGLVASARLQPKFATVMPKQSSINARTSGDMKAGDGMIEIFPFNAAPVLQGVQLYYGAAPQAHLPLPSLGSTGRKSFKGPVTIHIASSSPNSARRICQTTSHNSGFTSPPEPTCDQVGNCVLVEDGVALFNVEYSLEQVRLVACDQKNADQVNHFKHLPSQVVSGYAGDSTFSATNVGYFADGAAPFGATTLEQICHKQEIDTTFETFKRSVDSVESTTATEQTTHRLQFDVWVAAATNDTSAAQGGEHLYGYNVAPSDTDTGVMRADNCGCKEIASSTLPSSPNITAAILTVIDYLSGVDSGLYAIAPENGGYKVTQCGQGAGSSAVGVDFSPAFSKPSSGSTCLRKLVQDPTKARNHVMTTSTTATLSSGRMVDNFEDVLQVPGKLACVHLTGNGLLSTKLQGNTEYPIHSFQVKSALSAEKTPQRPGGTTTDVPVVKVIQATAGSSRCMGDGDFDHAGATAPVNGFKSLGDTMGGSCKSGKGTFDAILAVSTQPLKETMGIDAQVQWDELGNLTSLPNWTDKYGANILSNCAHFGGEEVGTTRVERFKCDYKTFTRPSPESTTVHYVQMIGSCVTTSGTTVNSAGSTTESSAAAPSCSGGEYRAIVTKSMTTTSTNAPAHAYLVEADQYHDYKPNTQTTYTPLGAFKDADTGTVRAPSTSMQFRIREPPAGTSGSTNPYSTVEIMPDSYVGMTVTTCAATIPSATLVGEHTPGYARYDLLQGGQRIHDSTNRIEMQARCSDDKSTPCTLGSHRTPASDGAACGYYDTGNTRPKRCGIRKVALSMTATNSYFFTPEYLQSSSDKIGVAEYAGYIGTSNAGNLVTSWTSVDGNPNTNSVYNTNQYGTSTRLRVVTPNWAVASQPVSQTIVSDSFPNGALSDAGSTLREFDVAATIVSLGSKHAYNWDGGSLTAVASGSALMAPQCPLSAASVTRIASTVSLDATVQQSASYTSSARTVSKSAQWMSFQVHHNFAINPPDHHIAFEYSSVVDLMGNEQKVLTGRQPGAGARQGVLTVKVRLQTALSSQGSKVSIFRGTQISMKAVKSTNDARPAQSQSGDIDHTICEFVALHEPTSHTAPEPSSACLITDTELTTLWGDPDYTANKCATTAHSIKQTGSSGGCAVLTDQSVEFALAATPGNIANCQYFEDLQFESATVDGIDDIYYSTDLLNTPDQCAAYPTDFAFYYLKSHEAWYQMCSITGSDSGTCSDVTKRQNQFTVGLSAIDARLSTATLSGSPIQVEKTSRFRLAMDSSIDVLHPAVKFDDGFANVNTVANGNVFTNGNNQGPGYNVETIGQIPLVDTLVTSIINPFRVDQGSYMALAPRCDKADGDQVQTTRFESICGCAPTPGDLTGPLLFDKVYGRSTADMNKRANATSTKGAYKPLDVLWDFVKTMSQHEAAAQVKSGVNHFTSFISFRKELYVRERQESPAKQPRVETALVVACLTPRSSTVIKAAGPQLAEEMPSTYGSFTTDTPRRQLCKDHEAIVYLHWGSKAAFDYLVSANKHYAAVPRCSAARRKTPVGSGQTKSHGAPASDQTPAPVYDLSKNIVAAVATVDERCRVTASGNFNATDPAVGTYHDTYTYDVCDVIPKTQQALDRYEKVSKQTHTSGLFTNDHLEEMRKVKAFAFDLNPGAKYGTYISESFQKGDAAYTVSTLTVDAKLFGAYASVVEFKEIMIVSEETDTGGTRRKVVTHNKRHLLQAEESSSSGNLMTGGANVPQCPHVAGATGTLEDASASANTSSTYCASFTCPEENLRLSASDSAGFSFFMDCLYPDQGSDDKDLIIWMSLGLSLLGLILACGVLTYLGYTQRVAKAVEREVKSGLQEVRAVL